MEEERELLSLIGALIVEIALKDFLPEPIAASCYTTLKLPCKVTPALYGYRLKRLNGETHIVVHDKEAAIIASIFRDSLNGMPLSVIQDKVKEMGFPRTGPYAIHKVLENCFYAGWERKFVVNDSSGIFIRTFHPPIVSETDFLKVQRLLCGDSLSKVEHAEGMPLKGVLKCSCGTNMTAGWYKGKNQHYLYYRCLKHMQTGYSGQKLHEQYGQLLKQFVLKSHQLRNVTDEVGRILDDILSEHRKMIALKSADLNESVHKLVGLDEKVRDGQINQEMYLKWYERFRLQRESINTELNDLIRSSNSICSSVSQMIPHAGTMYALYRLADYRQKQLLLKGIFKGGLVYIGNKFVTDNINYVFRSCIKRSAPRISLR